MIANSNKLNELNSFLKKVQQLRSYEDINTEAIVQELKNHISQPKAKILLRDLALRKTWTLGKSKLIDDVETAIGDTMNL